MSQKYGELAQVFRTGVPFEYPTPKDLSKGVVDRLGEEAAMKRADYLAELSERRKLVLGQNNTNIQLYSELIGRLHEDTHKKLQASTSWTTIETKQDAKGLMEALTKIMTICSSGNLHQDSHKARMIYCVINQGPEESLLDYYTRTTRSLASLTALKQLLDLDINQAMDFTYKLDRKQFGLMITNMDCAEELEMLKHAETLETDPLAVFKTTYPKTLTEAFQRANSHLLGHGKTTTGIVTNSRQTVFASDAAPHTEKREKRKLIPKEEWLKMTKEQQDAVKASHAAQKTKTKCAYCSKSGHNESECRALKTVIAELKKENLKKTVAYTTTSREEEGEEEEEDSFSETVYVHTTAATYVHKTESVHTIESVLRTGDNPPSEDLVLCDMITVHQQLSSETRSYLPT